MDVDDVRATTHGTVFDVLLIGTRLHVNRNDNYFATGLTDVGGVVLHVLSVSLSARVVVHLGRPQQPLSLWTIDFLDSFIPAATVLKLNFQVFGVEPKHRYYG